MYTSRQDARILKKKKKILTVYNNKIKGPTRSIDLGNSIMLQPSQYTVPRNHRGTLNYKNLIY